MGRNGDNIDGGAGRRLYGGEKGELWVFVLDERLVDGEGLELSVLAACCRRRFLNVVWLPVEASDEDVPEGRPIWVGYFVVWESSFGPPDFLFGSLAEFGFFITATPLFFIL